MVYYRFSSASNRLIPAAQSFALSPQGLSVAGPNTNPIIYEAGTKMFNSAMRVARVGASRMASSAAGEAPPAHFDPLNPGKWMVGAGGKLMPRLPEGTKVGPLVMGKYGLYHPKIKAKVDELEAAESHGARMERATAGHRTLSSALYVVTGACLVLALWNLTSALFDKPLPPFVNANKQIHKDL